MSQQDYSRKAYKMKFGSDAPQGEQERRTRQPSCTYSKYISTPEAAEYLGVSESYLNKARHFGRGPPYVRFGRAIRYSRDVLDDWAEQRTTTGIRDY
jgi:excisionase family DNA binding protein